MYVLLWIFGVLPAVLMSVFWLAPKGSFVERHIDWVLTPVFLALLCGLVLVLGRMDDPPPLREPGPIDADRRT